MNPNLERLSAIVAGRVQGVSFRYYTVLQAQELGITGWVRNLPDRTVEVCAEGVRAKLEELLKFLHSGSPAAQVTQVTVDWQTATGEFVGFKTRYFNETQ